MLRAKTLFFLFIISLFFYKGTAQEKIKRDSLKNLINHATSDSIKSRNMFLLADRIRNDEPKEAMRLADAVILISKNINYKELELNSYVLKGTLFTDIGKTDDAFVLLQQVLKYENDTNLFYPVGNAYSSLVNYYRQKGELKPALECGFKAEKYFLLQPRKINLVSTYTNIGGIFFDLSDFDKALEYDFKAIELAGKINYARALPSLYSNVGGCYGEKKMPDSAMIYYRQSLALALQQENYEIAASATQAIGFEFYDANQLDSANYYLLEAKKYYDQEEYYDESYPTINTYLGMLETKRKNYPLGLAYLQKADSASVTLSFLMDKIEIKKSLANLYSEMGNWQKAFEFQRQYVLLNDSMQRQENIKVTRELEKKYDTAKKEKENTELKSVNDLQQQKLKARNYLLAATIGGIALLCLLLFFIFRNYRNERKHVAILDKLNLQLTHQRDEILNINQLLQLKVLRTQMNPHFIYNCLNAINNLVMKGESEKASNYLLNFSKLLRMILDFSDKTFVDLEDEIKFIQLYLSLEAMRMGNDFSYEVKAPQQILDDDIGVPSLLIQPFIENAIWHGLINKEGAKKLSVSFEQSNDTTHLTCTVEDNGIGREKAAEAKRNNHTMLHESKGIRITQERIELLQYQVKNEVSVTFSDKVNSSNEAEGTLVKLVLPVNG